MKITWWHMPLWLVGTIRNKRLRVLLLAALVVASMGVWTHRLYAARAHAEKKLQTQTATLNDVMAKLDRLQTQMEHQSEVMTAKLNSLEYQNARLASLEMGDRARDARLETASAAAPSPQWGRTPRFLSRLPELDADICGTAGVKGGLSFKPKMKLIGKLKGNIGAEAVGNGIEGDLLLRADGSVDGEVGGDIGFDGKVCWKIPIDTAGMSQDFVDNVRNQATELASVIETLYLGHPLMQPKSVAEGLKNLDATAITFTPQTILNAAEDPSTTFQQISALTNSLPLPGNLSSLLSPGSLRFAPQDFAPGALCGNLSGGTGLISYVCSNVPSQLGNLSGVSAFINNLASFGTNLSGLQTKVDNIGSGLSSTCSAFNTGITQLNNTTVQFGGFHITTLSLLGNSYSIDAPSVVRTPFAPPKSLPTVQCPSL